MIASWIDLGWIWANMASILRAYSMAQSWPLSYKLTSMFAGILTDCLSGGELYIQGLMSSVLSAMYVGSHAIYLRHTFHNDKQL